ncbi:DUF6705 family protein [Flavobacterium litorale]|uniref:DUF6705 domain-containing protein n=1 Tax=Flavobacterium litorale TaxID=2856519 RepID=A0ABX8V3U3_9FLAO|nr:DUF6705 family protein [Flavobacterium litorale]QYJ67437.1 hypothetical protein K1I41_07665 [Flavobacterium litorale]
MKLYKVLFTLLIFNCVIAQELPITSYSSFADLSDNENDIKNGNYTVDTNNERDQYVGTWEYNQNGITFQVKIEKIDQFLNKAEHNGQVHSYNYADVVTFKYKLIKNGITIHDNLNYTFTINDIIPTATKETTDNFLYGGFLDYNGQIMATVIITRLNSIPEKIDFNVSPMAYYLLQPTENYIEGQQLFFIPTGNIEMTKID